MLKPLMLIALWCLTHHNIEPMEGSTHVTFGEDEDAKEGHLNHEHVHEADKPITISEEEREAIQKAYRTMIREEEGYISEEEDYAAIRIANEKRIANERSTQSNQKIANLEHNQDNKNNKEHLTCTEKFICHVLCCPCRLCYLFYRCAECLCDGCCKLLYEEKK